MIYPTRTAVLARARVLCGDTAVAGGQHYTDAFLTPFLDDAWGDLVQASNANELPHTVVETSIIHPANSTFLNSSLEDMGAVEEIREAGFSAANRVGITNVVLNSALEEATITTAGHPFQTGQTVYHFGIGGITPDINERWVVERVDGVSYKIRGVRAVGAYTSGGTAVYTAEAFSGPLMTCRYLEPRAPTTTLGLYALSRGGRVRLPACSVDRLLLITLRLSQTLPATFTFFPIEGCNAFLAYATAGAALADGDMPQRGRQHLETAYGLADDGRSIANAPALRGELGVLLGKDLVGQQKLAFRRPRARRRWRSGIAGLGLG